MEENKENKIDTEELKTETSSTVNQVKDTIKNVDIKKDSIETKGFVKEFFKDPLNKIKEISEDATGKLFKYAVIILVIWTAAVLLKYCFTSASNYWNFKYMFRNLLLLVKVTISPILGILVMSLIVFLMNKNNKKSLVTTITSITTANIPTVISSIIGLFTIISSNMTKLTAPFSSFCGVISIVLTYFSIKSLLGEEKNSEFIKKFVIIEAIYYVAYFVLTFLGIYI